METVIPPSSKTSSSKGCTILLIKLGAFILALYLLQWILQLALAAPKSDEIAQVLSPYHNHYLSFSRYYLTTEGAASEFTDDTTAVGRALASSILVGIVWFVLMGVLYMIKPLKKYQSPIFWTTTILIFGSLFYSEFFVPRRKATFTGKELVVDKSEWIFFKTNATVPYSVIEKFEYDFQKDHDVHIGDILYSQLFVVIGGERHLIGENQIPIVDPSVKATEEQKADAQKAVDALNKLVK